MSFHYCRKSLCLLLILIADICASSSSPSSIIAGHDDNSRHRLPSSPSGTIFGDPTHPHVRSHDVSSLSSSSSGWSWPSQSHQSSHSHQQKQQHRRNTSVETGTPVNDYEDEESPLSLSSKQTVSQLFRTIGQFWVSHFDIPSVIPSLLSSVIDGPSLLVDSNSDSNNKNDNPTLSLRRSLQKSDFDDLNNILKSVTVLAPDTTIKKKVLWNTLDLDLKNIRCYEISIHDLTISFQKLSPQKISVAIEIIGLDMWCALDWRYDWGIFHDGGNAQMYSDDNAAKTMLSFGSEDFGSMAPNGSSVESCETNIVITDIDIQGDFVAKIINAMEKSIRGTVSNAIEDVLCDELGTLGSSKVSDLLGVVNDMIEKYKAPLPPALANPLKAESDLILASQWKDLEILDMTTTETTIGTWFNRALSEIDGMLGQLVDDPQSPLGNGKDLGMNKLLRSTILDATRTYLIPVDQWPSSVGNDGVIFDGHDKISQTTIVLNSMRVRGLDSFRVFDPLNTIGKYTLGNFFKLDFLELEVDLTVTMRPSSHSSAVLVNPGGEPQVERLTVSTRLKDISIDMSFLLAIDQELLGNTQLGSLLTKNRIMNCFSATLHQTQLTGLMVSIDDIETPRMVGFVDAGLDRIIKTATELAFVMYKAPLLQALPNAFQTTVRDFVNEFLNLQINRDDASSKCPLYDASGGDDDDVVIDYRDLFLSPSNASAMGGSGLAPYGDVGPMMMNLLEEHLLSDDDDDGELSKINARVIRPFTKSQSGIDGMLRFNESDIVNVEKNFSGLLWSSMIQSLEFRLFDGRLENIDTVRNPLLFQPNRDSHMALDNSMAMGQHESLFQSLTDDSPRPFISGIRTLFDLGGKDSSSPLAMRNDLDITMTIPSMELTFNLILPLLEKNFLQFPLKSITNGHCWLASLSSNDQAATAISTFLLSLPSILQLNVSCVSCTSPGLHILPDVIDIIAQNGGIDELTNRFSIVLDELLRGEYVKNKLHRSIVDARKKCPHHEAYRKPLEKWPALDGPAVSRDALELGLLSFHILLHATMAIVAESHSDAHVGIADPLSGQNSLDVPSTAQLIDFTNLTSSLGVVGSFADAALGQINDRLGEMVEDVTEGPNFDMTGEDLYINVMLRETFLDEYRALTLPIGDKYRLDTEDLSLALRSVRIKGLDTVKELHILDPIGRQTFMNELRLHHLDLEIELSVKPTTATGRRMLAEEEQIVSMSFGIDDVDATVAILFALDLNLLGDVQLGSVLHLDQILPCLLSASHAVDFSQLSLSIGDMREPTVKGFLSEDTMQAIKKTTTALFETYKAQIVASTPAFFDQTVRPLLNQILSGFVTAESNRACPRPQTLDDYVNFHDLFLSQDEAALSGGSGTSPYGNVFSHLVTTVDNHVLATDDRSGLSKINDLLFAPLTQSQSGTAGTLRFPGDLFGGATKIDVGGFKATVDLRAFDATLEHVNSVGRPLKLLDPVEGEGSLLENTATFGVGVDPMRVSVGLLIEIMGEDDDDLQMRNELIVSLNLRTATILAKTLIKMKENLFLSFPLRDILNLNCWLATMPSSDLNAYGIGTDNITPSLHLQDLAIAIAELELHVECISCTSPGFEELAQSLSLPAAVKDATLIGNKIINYLTTMAGGDYLAVKIDQLLYNARKSCPHHDSYDPNYVAPSAYKPLEVPDYTVDSLNFLMALLIVGGLLFSFIGIATLVVKRLTKLRHERWMATLSPDELYNVDAQQRRMVREERQLSQRTKSLALSEEIPLVVRILMPFIILGNIGLFLSGHLSLGATVSIKAEIAGEMLQVDEFFKFSMAYSIQEMWQAGAKSLAVLILIFSGVWPYTKQCMTFVLWFLPPTRCSITKRGRIFLWLDGFAKWSMVDIFVLLTTLAAFRITINSPEGLAFLPDGFYSVDLAVIPLWGLYANMLAQLISQVSSHFIIYYHRCVVASATTTTAPSDGDKLAIARQDTATTSTEESKALEPLYKHSYQTDFHSNGRHAYVHRSAITTLITGALAVTTLIIVGCTLHSFTLEVLGLIGIAVESGQQFQPATTSHNVFSLVGVIMEEARFLDVGRYYVGLGTLAALLVLTTLIVPIVQAWGLVYQWLAPLSKRGRYRMHVAIECLAAWQYVEVYILSVIITAWQISGVSSFMVNAYCGSLTETFKQMAYYGIIDNADAQCFSVEATLEGGVYALIVAAIVLGGVNHFVCKAAEQRDREEHGSANVVTSHRDDGSYDKSDEVSEDNNMYHDDELGRDKLSTSSIVVRSIPVRFTDTYQFFLTTTVDDNDGNTVTDKSSSSCVNAVCCFAVPSDSCKAFESKTSPPRSSSSTPDTLESSKEAITKVDPEIV